MRYHQHDDSQPVAWNSTCRTSDLDAQCEPGGTPYPVVFVAKGSHASYPKAGLTTQCVAGGRLCSVDIHQQGKPRATWLGPLQDVAAEPWYGFGGAWGAVGSLDDFTGPLGPSRYKR